MRILIDIGHPAHVHLFKNFAWKLQEKGHKILFTCRDREFLLRLLQVYGFIYENFGRHYKSIGGKIQGLIKNELQMFNTAIQFKPDLFLSHGSSIAAFTSFLLHKPHISFEDTFNMEQVRLYLPFTDVVLTGDYPHPSLGRKEIKYPGYHELAYLHPNVFTPNENFLKELGVEKNEKYAIIRFVAWNATHDIGHRGFSKETKIKLVTELSKYIKVFISSEKKIKHELQQYELKINPRDMHSVLANASILICDSQSMSVEAAILGVPSIRISDFVGRISVLEELEHKYGLTYGVKPGNEDFLFERFNYLLNNKYLKDNFQYRKNNMLRDKIDVTAFLVWFVENYPESVKIMKETPEYQYRFR